MINVLCVSDDSVYKSLPGIEVWDRARDAYNFKGSEPVITHAPCAQWSRMREFAKEDQYEKMLAHYCYRKVIENGGIFEHPCGSSFFRQSDVDMTNVYSVDQSWFGFPARKRTWLYFSKCKPLAMPIMLDIPKVRVQDMSYLDRSKTTLQFAVWLINCVKQLE